MANLVLDLSLIANGLDGDAAPVQAAFDAIEARANDLPDDQLDSPHTGAFRWRAIAVYHAARFGGDSGEKLALSSATRGVRYFDPADYAVPGKVLKVRLRTIVWSGVAAGLCNLRLRAITAVAATAVAPVDADYTRGAIICTAGLAANDATVHHATGSQVAFPAAGFYGLTHEAPVFGSGTVRLTGYLEINHEDS